MTVRYAFERLRAQLAHWALSPAHADQTAYMLIEWATGFSRVDLMVRSSAISIDARALLDQAIHELLKEHKPLAYIIGTQSFLDMELRVRPPVLIPRVETEAWCAELIAELRMWSSPPRNILDLCTGSGCIAIALARAFPCAHIVAVDIDERAIALARENGARYAVSNIDWMTADLYTELVDQKFDVIVSNPPYIACAEHALLHPSVRDWESVYALRASDGGYAVLERIITGAGDWLSDCPDAQVWLEIDRTQSARTTQFFASYGFCAKTKQDLSGQDRVVIGKRVDA